MPNCPKCNKPVYFAEKKTSMGKDWHANCLRCSNPPCNKVLTPGNHSEHEDKPYCTQCHRALFGPKTYGFGGTESHTFHGGQTGQYEPRFHPGDSHPAVDYGDGRIQELGDADPSKKFIISTRIRVARTLMDYAFVRVMSQEDFLHAESSLKTVFESIELCGTYYPLSSITNDVQKKLIADHFLFSSHGRLLTAVGGNQYWPNGRGAFFNTNKNFLAWMNEEDHLRIISMEKGGDIGSVWARLVKGIKFIQSKVQFARDDRLGYLTFCQSNLGSTVRASVHIKLRRSLYSKKGKEVIENYDLQVRGAEGEDSEVGGSGICDVSNKQRLGIRVRRCEKYVQKTDRIGAAVADEGIEKMSNVIDDATITLHHLSNWSPVFDELRQTLFLHMFKIATLVLFIWKTVPDQTHSCV